MAAVDQRVLAEDVFDRPAQRLGAVDDEQDRLLAIKAAIDKIGQQRPGESCILGAAFPQPERDLDALRGDAQRDDVGASAISKPSSIITARRTSSRRRDISSPSAVRVRSTNSSETVLFDVDDAARSTCSPTGSPTRGNFLVETPASIRSITALVSGSRSAKYS